MDMMPVYATQMLNPMHEFANISLWQPPPGSGHVACAPTSFMGKGMALDFLAVQASARATRPLTAAPSPFGVQPAAATRPGTGKGERAEAQQPVSDVDAITEERVLLMAAKYAATSKNIELEARLEMLNRRLLDKSPSVTESQVEFLEGVGELLKQLDEQTVARARRLGLAA